MPANKPSVLLVDDVPANLVALEALLADMPCVTVRAASGNEALLHLLQREFAVVLLDVQMPEMDGFEVARYARAHPATREVPIIFVTAMHETEEERLRGYGTGAVDFLFKPVNAYILRSKVAVFLELYASRRRLADEIKAHQQTLAELETLSYSISHDLRPRVMIERVAELIVPGLADWCVVRLDGGATMAARHRDPQVPLGPLLEIAASPSRVRELRESGESSVMVVPLPVRGRDLGTITMVSEDPARRFAGSDVRLAVELGRRVALAVDNALLYVQAQEAVRLRDEFLGVASHELKTPLTALQLRQQSLLRALEREPGCKLRGDFRDRLELAVKKAARLGELIESLLDVSRIVTGLLALHLEDVNLGELVAEVAEDFDDALTRAGCTLVTRVRPDIVGRWDRMRLEQVVTNLLANAIKFGERKPIELTVDAADGQAILQVRDQGIGIDPEHQSRIFDRFERGVPARSYGGLGLGLFITRRVAEAHGGSVAAEGLPGKGATFTVVLPLVAAGAVAEGAENLSERGSPRGG